TCAAAVDHSLAGEISLAGEVSEAREALEGILADLRAATNLKAGEAALDAVAVLLGLPWACWVPDTSHPYELPQMDAYARAHGWPDELLKLWWSRHAALKMPFYIRCRFEQLPFLISLDHRHHLDRASREQTQITELIHRMGVTTLLVVPLHLSKGQVAIIVWGGNRKVDELTRVLTGIEGDLLAIGHRFMRIASHSLHSDVDGANERSRLTPREWDCVRTLAQGYREAEIANLIGIKKATVRFHLDNVVDKFGCKTRAQAAALLGQLGLLGPIGT
ncbi:MAG TPA: helix-turn-helix transcriptional regulator, partial [Steroidobacteraceae bacterium]|nr:helix-turn-helix transcriptional regulator [Steroidobacteraceae bacterium]